MFACAPRISTRSCVSKVTSKAAPRADAARLLARTVTNNDKSKRGKCEGSRGSARAPHQRRVATPFPFPVCFRRYMARARTHAHKPRRLVKSEKVQTHRTATPRKAHSFDPSAWRRKVSTGGSRSVTAALSEVSPWLKVAAKLRIHRTAMVQPSAFRFLPSSPASRRDTIKSS